MLFQRLTNLGEDKLRAVMNALMRGQPALQVARTIQAAPPEGWGPFQDVQELSLMQQLRRFRKAIAEAHLG